MRMTGAGSSSECDPMQGTTKRKRELVQPMDPKKVLEISVRMLVKELELSESDVEVRKKVLFQLTDSVTSTESLKGSTVQVYGSYRSMLSTRCGDLDISVNTENDPSISPTKHNKVRLLRELYKTCLKGGYSELKLISSARYPLLKVVAHGVSCDISVCNKRGYLKSEILRQFSDVDARFPQLVLLLKNLVMVHDVKHDGRVFNSFSLSLMALYHLQTCQPSILPPLSDVFKDDVVKSFKASETKESEIFATCSTAMDVFKKGRLQNSCSTLDLLLTFISKFSDMDKLAREWEICPYTGSEIRRSNTGLHAGSALVIRDPFDMLENAARTVTEWHIRRMSQALHKIGETICSSNYDKEVVIPMLAGPLVCESLNLNCPGLIAKRKRTV